MNDLTEEMRETLSWLIESLKTDSLRSGSLDLLKSNQMQMAETLLAGLTGGLLVCQAHQPSEIS